MSVAHWVVGVDGAPGGWMVAEATTDESRPPIVAMEPSLRRAVDRLLQRDAETKIAIDMPIGLSTTGDRPADRAARDRLGPRRSTFFPTPVHAVLDCNSWDEANAASREHSGRGLSKQSWNLVPKIREVDAVWAPELIDSMVEAHPESSFAEMAGGPLPTRKTTPEGREARLELLGSHVHSSAADAASSIRPVTDAVDALGLLWTARRVAAGTALVLGDHRDRRSAVQNPYMPIGRYAPSPTGPLHVGNLRTGLLAWLYATADPTAPGGELRLRIDDLDPRTVGTPLEAQQIADLEHLGIEFSGPVMHQSERFEHYRHVIDELERSDDTYPCYCSRREIREAAQAPHLHLPDGAYPGTCRDLDERTRSARRAQRPAAIRVRADAARVDYHDRIHGRTSVEVDDFVIVRNDGVPSYNLATVIDDEAQGVTQVVRGSDLLEGTGRQIWLRHRLGLGEVEHVHVPLMINAEGQRLAKRDGAVTLVELAELGHGASSIRGALAHSIGLTADAAPLTVPALRRAFDPDKVGTADTVWIEPDQNTSSDNV